MVTFPAEGMMKARADTRTASLFLVQAWIHQISPAHPDVFSLDRWAVGVALGGI